jgi:asparagine synthase (glutamine-hydrolysing)
MCGIAGYAGPKDEKSSQTAVCAMIAALNRRGPDARGIYHSGEMTLGCCRLSIFDLTEAGNQPMISEDGRTALVFNGAIYNFRELRRELKQQGCHFRSHSDTEVLLHGYSEWGMYELLARIRGMFAIALWDDVPRKLFLARDRLGVKPLYYTIHQRGLAFASTVRALRVASLVSELDPRAVAEFLEFGFVTDDRAIYKGARKVAAAHVIEWSNGAALDKEYWTPPRVSEVGISFEEAVEETERLLLRAVEARLFADVPVGALLSGGIDSSLICWAASKLGADVTAYTIGIPGDPTDEGADAAETARVLRMSHRILTLSPNNIPNPNELVAAYGEPFGCASALGVMHISAAVKPGVAVLLTGDGGDDVFLGYPEHKHLWLAQRLAMVIPKPVSPVWYTARKLVRGITQLHRPMHFLDYATGGLAAVTTAHEGWPSYQEAGLLGERLSSIKLWQREIGWSPAAGRRVLTDWLRYHLNGQFSGEYMTKLDGGTMYHALEARSPFLDQELWEFAAKLPYRLRLRNGRTKAVLRELARRHFGERVSNRPKRGFSVPVQHWLVDRWLDSVKECFRGSLLQRGGWIRADAVLRAVERAAAQRQASQQLWYLYVLEFWLRYETSEKAVTATTP